MDEVRVAVEGQRQIFAAVRRRCGGGKNIAPQNLENELKSSRFVSQALVVGDRRPYVSALVTLDEQEVAKWRAGGLLPSELAT